MFFHAYLFLLFKHFPRPFFIHGCNFVISSRVKCQIFSQANRDIYQVFHFLFLQVEFCQILDVRFSQNGYFCIHIFKCFTGYFLNRHAQGTHKAKVFLKKKTALPMALTKLKFSPSTFLFSGGGWLQAHNIYHNQLRPHSFLAIHHLFCYVVLRKLTRAPSWLNVDKVADFSEWRGGAL